jgi:hypothetical protein
MNDLHIAIHFLLFRGYTVTPLTDLLYTVNFPNREIGADEVNTVISQYLPKRSRVRASQNMRMNSVEISSQ